MAPRTGQKERPTKLELLTLPLLASMNTAFPFSVAIDHFCQVDVNRKYRYTRPAC